MWIRAGAIGAGEGGPEPHLDHAHPHISLGVAHTTPGVSRRATRWRETNNRSDPFVGADAFFHQDRSTVYEPKVIRIHSTGLLFHLFSRVGQTDLKTFFFSAGVSFISRLHY